MGVKSKLPESFLPKGGISMGRHITTFLTSCSLASFGQTPGVAINLEPRGVRAMTPNLVLGEEILWRGGEEKTNTYNPFHQSSQYKCVIFPRAIISKFLNFISQKGCYLVVELFLTWRYSPHPGACAWGGGVLRGVGIGKIPRKFFHLTALPTLIDHRLLKIFHSLPEHFLWQLSTQRVFFETYK